LNLYRTYENTAYNRREFIRVAINSVINSTLPEDEYEIIVGQVSEGEKHRLYMTSAVYALPSIYKPFRITLLEAGMHGTPSAITGEGDKHTQHHQTRQAYGQDQTQRTTQTP